MSPRARIGAGAVAALAVVAALLGALPRGRPDFGLASSSPADRATVAEAPAEIELAFTAAVDPERSHLAVLDRSAVASTAGRPRLVAPGRLRQPVRVATGGEVSIGYHVTSVDGAEAAGVLRFTARAGTPDRTAAGPAPGAAAAHAHDVDPVGAALLVLDGLVGLGVAVLLTVRRRHGTSRLP